MAALGARTRSQTLFNSESSSTPSTLTTRPSTSSRQVSTSAHTGLCVPRRQSSHKTEAATLTAAEPSSSQTCHPEHTSGSFEELVTAEGSTVLVDFYAPWCGPCELMSRVVSKLSLELKEDLKVVKVNADNYPKLASKYRVQALPTCLLFRDGKLIDRVNGFMPEAHFGRRVRFYVARLDKKFGRR